MTPAPDESPTERQPASPTWVGSASVPPGGSRRRRQWEDTLDLPAAPRTLDLPAAPPEPPPQVRYVPVVPPGYGPPPPGYRPGPFPPPPQFRRRRRKWPWVFLVMFALCAGCSGTGYAWARQWWVQYPASVRTEATVPGLTRLNDAGSTKAAQHLQTSLTSDHLDESGFTAAYRDDSRQVVLVFGATRFITHPTRDLEASLDKLGRLMPVQDVREVDAGPLGGQQRCAASRYNGKSATTCGWSDHGMIAIAVFPGRSLESAATATQNLRASITVRD